MADRYYQPANKADALRHPAPFEAEQAVVDAHRSLILKHQARLEEAFRLLRAAHGVCPECGNPMMVDTECLVSDPPHGEEHHRVAPAALCGTCDTCIEL